MNNETLKLLEDCKDTFEFLLAVEFIENKKCVYNIISDISNAINNEINGK